MLCAKMIMGPYRWTASCNLHGRQWPTCCASVAFWSLFWEWHSTLRLKDRGTIIIEMMITEYRSILLFTRNEDLATGTYESVTETFSKYLVMIPGRGRGAASCAFNFLMM